MNTKAIHIVGIGGVGMSAIAQAYLDAGRIVTGSDRLADSGGDTPTLSALRKQGVRIFPQNGSGVADGTEKLVVSTAIESDNADLAAAQRLGIPVIHRSAALGEIVAGRRTVAVAGTCGKSTTTAILGWLLAEAGLDPEVIDGAAVVGWDCGGERVGSVRNGKGRWCVFEADESDRSFLRFHPDYAIITNTTPDHFDAAETNRLFGEFASHVALETVRDLPDAILPSGGWSGRFKFHDRIFTIPLPGIHNVCNAWQAVRMASAIGVADDAMVDALARFPGVSRRLERIGVTGGGVTVFDDYGHNPEKIHAAIASLKAVYDEVFVLWRPHGYRPLRVMLEPLAKMFAETLGPRDRLLVLPVYDAGGTADRTINSDALVRRIAELGDARAGLVENLESAEVLLPRQGGEGRAVLICGARDPGLPVLARNLT